MPNNPDVFISYAWRDNVAPPVIGVNKDTDRWVWMFADVLAGALELKLGRNVKVWVDRREMNAADRVVAVLRRELEHSRLLVVLMSPSWLNSDWCPHELDEFRRTHPGTDTREDVLVVEIEPVERAEWTRRIDVKGMSFYRETPPKSGSFQRHGHPVPKMTDTQFFDEITVLATEISKYLKRTAAREAASPEMTAAARSLATPDAAGLVVSAGTSAADDPATSPRVPTLWLADSTVSLARDRRDLIGAVRQESFACVAPDVMGKTLLPPAVALGGLRASMESASVLVQLLDDDIGPMAHEGRSWCRVQADEASRFARQRNLPFVKWRRPGSLDATSDSSHREVLLGAVEQSIEELRSDVLRHLRAAAGQPGRPQPPDPDSTPPGLQLCLTYTEDDLEIAEEVGGMLRDLGIDYEGIPTPSHVENHQRADQINELDDQTIRQATGVIIIYGLAAHDWLSAMVMRLNQLRGRRGCWGALIDAPALTPGKPLPRMVSTIQRLDWRERPRFDLLRQFVESLGVIRG